MNIQPIVEGHGEVDAVPVLLRRLRDEARAFRVRCELPDSSQEKPTGPRGRTSQIDPIGSAPTSMRGNHHPFDSDDDCPKVLVPTLQAIAQDEAGRIPCSIVLAHREYEAWFLASIESLRGKRSVRANADPHPHPEEPRGAKGQLEARMEKGKSYHESSDQAALSALFDMKPAFQQCRSFRRMVKAFGDTVVAGGESLGTVWPPVGW